MEGGKINAFVPGTYMYVHVYTLHLINIIVIIYKYTYIHIYVHVYIIIMSEEKLRLSHCISSSHPKAWKKQGRHVLSINEEVRTYAHIVQVKSGRQKA